MLPKSYWDKVYKIGETPWREPFSIENLIAKSGVAGGAALDLGCGTGEWAIELDKRGFKVEALDFSAEALKIAQEQKSNVSWTEWDLEKLNEYPFKAEKYDLVIDNKVLAFIQDKEKYLDTIESILRGTYVVTVFHEHDKGGICVAKTEFDRLTQPRFTVLYSDIFNPRPGKVVARCYLKQR